MTFFFPVTFLASLRAASFASAPLLQKKTYHRNYELQVILLLLLEVAAHKGSTRANTYPVVIQSLLVQTDDGVLNYTLLFLNRNQDTFFPSYPQLSFQLLEQLAH